MPAIDLSNPVLVKEMRSRMRGNKAYWIEIVYLLVLSGVLLMLYLTWLGTHRSGGPFSWELGRSLFHWLCGAQAVMMMLLAPAFAAGAITLEREQQTFEMLLLTPLRASAIVLGKLGSATLFVLLLLTTSLPLLSVCFMLGGVSPSEVATVYLAILQSALIGGALGLVWSALTTRTATATALTYGSVLAYFGGTLILGVWAAETSAYGYGEVPVFGGLNPITLSMVANEPALWLGYEVPLAYPTLFCNTILLVLLIACAVVQVGRERQPYGGRALRVLTLLFFVTLVALFAGNLSPLIGSPGSMSPSAGSWSSGPRAVEIQNLRNYSLVILGIVLGMLALAIPIFATGPGFRRPRGRWWERWSPGRLFRPELNTALAYLLLLLAAAAPCLILMGLAEDGSLRTSHSVTSTPTEVRYTDVEAIFLAAPSVLQMFLVVAITLVFYTLLTHLISYVLPGERWAAFSVSLILIALGLLLPIFTLFRFMPYSYAPQVLHTTTLLDQSAYLWPYWALFYSSNPQGFHHSMPSFWVGSLPFWAVTVLAYAVLSVGLLGLLGLLRWVRRRQRPRWTTP
jgi:hypothetical protein